MLIVLSGLPAVGKSSIAAALARRLGAMHVRIDTIEQALRMAGERLVEVGSKGYEIAHAVAEENLLHGLVVIADAVNASELVRDAWRAVAQRARASIVEVEVICSDREEHERRAAARSVDIPGLRLPTWSDPQSRVRTMAAATLCRRYRETVPGGQCEPTRRVHRRPLLIVTTKQLTQLLPRALCGR